MNAIIQNPSARERVQALNVNSVIGKLSRLLRTTPTTAQKTQSQKEEESNFRMKKAVTALPVHLRVDLGWRSTYYE